MAGTIALSDNQRTIFSIAIGMLGAAQAFIISNAVIGTNPVPLEVIWVLALVMAVLGPLREFLGVRDATTARVAKETVASIEQNRTIPPQK